MLIIIQILLKFSNNGIISHQNKNKQTREVLENLGSIKRPDTNVKYSSSLNVNACAPSFQLF